MEQIIRQCVGIDCSKDEFAVSFSVMNGDLEVTHLSSRKFNNDLAGFKGLQHWVVKLENSNLPLFFNMEATGVYHERLASFLFDANRKVSVVLPKRAKDFSKTLKVKTVTDQIASQYLAVMGLEKKLDLWTRPEPVYIRLRRLTRERSQIQDNITQLKNEKHAEESGAWPVKKPWIGKMSF